MYNNVVVPNVACSSWWWHVLDNCGMMCGLNGFEIWLDIDAEERLEYLLLRSVLGIFQHKDFRIVHANCELPVQIIETVVVDGV